MTNNAIKKRKTILIVICVFLSTVIICISIFCALFVRVDMVNWYTLDQHIERISEKIDRRFIRNENNFYGKYNVTDYRLYPLYDEYDNLKYFLIEFVESGFAFVELNDIKGIAINTNMYRCNDEYTSSTWWRYRMVSNEESITFENGKGGAESGESECSKKYCYEIDENGEIVKYNHSPYAVSSVLDKKMYLLQVYNGFIPAIKNGDRYLNLVSMEEIDYKGSDFYHDKGESYTRQNIPCLFFYFFVGLGGEL